MNDPRSARDVHHPATAAIAQRLAMCLERGHAMSLGKLSEIVSDGLESCKEAMADAAKPSPRETLLNLIVGLETKIKEHDGIAERYEKDRLDVACARHDGASAAYRDSITLIRSMAGHLMEQTDGH
jgi:hypothetical protein